MLRWLLVCCLVLLMLCSAPLAAQEPNWVQKSSANAPTPRWMPAMAYDAARGQVVLFGGTDNSFPNFNDTWVWDGTNWTQKSPANSPPSRYYPAAMAYDAAREQVVLFGGKDSLGAYLNDTWIWDGTNWAQKAPATSPSPRDGHAMAYDAARGQVVLFGGLDYAAGLNDTWVWDGTNWTRQSPANSPPLSNFHAMAYDPARQQVVLFGGSLDGYTWVWDGTNWTQKSPANSPLPRFYHAMAYDAARGQVILFGGVGNNNVLDNADTWVWDGTNWTQKSPANSPPPRYSPAMAYDAARRQVVLFGGLGTGPLNDTWVWPSDSASVQLYSVTDLGVLPGGTSSQAFAINNLGTVVGQSEGTPDTDFYGAGTTSSKPFIWTAAGGMQQVLGPSPSLDIYGNPIKPFAGVALGINDQGTLVGRLSYTFTGGSTPFFWTAANGMQFLHDQNGYVIGGGAYDVNNAGQVVGTGVGGTSAFRWTPTGGLESLESPGWRSSARAINKAGVSAGSMAYAYSYPVSWNSAGHVQYMDGLLNSWSSQNYATGINDT